MENYVKQFEKNGYVLLKGFLDNYYCKELSETLKKLVVDNKTVKDASCPKSHAIHSENAPVFDSLLEQLLPHFEKASGKKLLPTYAYSRLYAPGEVLKPHRDRESCEISATITVGFDGNPWPFFISKEENPESTDPILMNVGDVVLYKGQELYHWRNEYKEGEWQAQIFLHYVDAEGPNKDWVFDKREKLSHHTNMLGPDIEVLKGGQALLLHNAFSRETCEKIIKNIEKEQGESAVVGSGIVDKQIRDVTRIPIPVSKGIGATLTGIGINLNNAFYNFDVIGSNQSEFLRYGLNGHYKIHIDTFFDLKENPSELSQSRKLTILLFLNDDFEGGKLFLKTGDDKFYPPQKAGDVLIFPSFFPHSVEPVTKGTRVSLVNWLVGPMFK
jgi:predicted 2-oxoglutarate/Fe(II)-dependent dioxygenase YbiX